MVIVVLVLLGLALGSFVNALVWRIHKQSAAKSKADKQKYSISKGRSMCVNCGHQLEAKDLIPIVSWVAQGGKCRYCKKPISLQYPIVEAVTAILFVISYLFWPADLAGYEIISFISWLGVLVIFVALLIYDIRWTLLPNKLVTVLYSFTAVFALSKLIDSSFDATALVDLVIAITVGGGIFYVLFIISKGRWIGGGDVKIGFALGALCAQPQLAFLLIFLASVLGSVYSLPLMATSKLSRFSKIAFGPFLIAATIIVVLFGAEINELYLRLILSTVY